MIEALFHTISTWATANADLLKVLLPIITLFGAILLAMWRRVAALFAFLKDRYFNRLQVCVIANAKAKRLDDFLELYHAIFRSDERIATKEILDWLRWKAKDVGIQYRLYLAIHKSHPVGIAISLFDRQSGILFIPYLGIANLDVQWRDTKKIIRALLNTVSRTAHKWKVGIVEVADPDEPAIEDDEVKRRRARIRRLRALAGGVGLEMIQPDIAYIQPVYHTDVDERDLRTMVLFLLESAKRDDGLPKEIIMDALTFVYHKVYRPSFGGPPETVAAYEEDLSARLSELATTLAEIVPVRR